VTDARTARAIWFGKAAAPLFGIFHPALDHAKDVVVVMCNPFGYDAINTHRAYQRLAESLARAGVAALRFDYLGTGNSAGDDEAPDQLATWLSNIGDAIREARRSSGASKVVLFGVRVGALLAIAYAQTAPVDGLVLLGPPRSGATLIRELSALNSIRAANPRDHASSDIAFPEDESDGYPLSSELRTAMASLDPNAASERAAARALVIARDDLPGREAKLIERLRELGVDVQHSQAPGYRGMYAHFLPLPQPTVDEIVRFAVEAATDPFATLVEPSIESSDASGRAAFEGFSEEVVQFEGLFGIVTQPTAGAKVRDTAVLVLGTGNNPHTGLGRTHVTFARALSALGFRVLRFDLSGIGESPARPGQPDRVFYNDLAVPETRMAIDFMISRGCAQVALFGLCSGGYTAFHSAVIDGRVVAIMPVNSPGFHFNRFDSAALSVSVRAPWLPTRSVAKGCVAVKISPVNHPGNRVGIGLASFAMNGGFPGIRIGDWVPRIAPSLLDYSDDVARGLGKMLERGTKARFVYGSADFALDVFEAHVGADVVAGRVANLDVALVSGTNHTFTPRIAQQRLRALLTEFFDRTLR
jgi:alpha-beta hydrolase superfamily lysophospholipase